MVLTRVPFQPVCPSQLGYGQCVILQLVCVECRPLHHLLLLLFSTLNSKLTFPEILPTIVTHQTAFTDSRLLNGS